MNRVPREIMVPHRKIPLAIPPGMTAIEFFNSAANLENLARENGLLVNQDGFLLYRKLLGHSLEFDTSIILDTSQTILNPLGRPVRRDQLTEPQRHVWSRMSQTIFNYMLDRYPDPDQHLLLCGEASLDPTWPLSKPGVPSIRMIHNHFIVFPMDELRAAPAADPDNPNLTDGGHNNLFLSALSGVYGEFMQSLHLQYLRPIATNESQLLLTGYPQGLPSWEAIGGNEVLHHRRFWDEYDLILRGFLDFYRTFFAQVATRGATAPANLYFPQQVEDILMFNNEFFRAAREIRGRIKADPHFANDIRWQPAYKQILYRDNRGKLIVTISPNSVGNAITELLGIVVRRQVDDEGYAAAEPALVKRLLEVRDRLVDADLGDPVRTPSW
ncbi:MAG: hypothetical protein HQL58_02320 [Magnetococcales bacterium]|nr:hypothetical protein [Magnetococcales bacterium]